jgi:hypothetical protein
MGLSSRPLSYCTNVHPAQNVEDILNGLNEYTAVAQREFGEHIAAGLWLSRQVSSELLQQQAKLESLAQTLWQNDLCCYTLNAFPYGDFHSERVKEQVYLPDWSTPERLQYTKDCAQILSLLLHEGAEGSISTVPLGGRMNPTGPGFIDQCLQNLVQMARDLDQIHSETGRLIRLAVEPEPMCEMSSIPQLAVPLFQQLFDLAVTKGCLPLVQKYIGLCFDVCHQAVEFEDIADSFAQLANADIRINKLHITNALELLNPAENAAGREFLRQFVEPRYLHQTYARMSDGSILTRTDLLDEDLTKDPPDQFMTADAWRIHFHVPVFAETLGPLNTTRPDLKIALKCVSELDYAPDLEVETYTWPVMPDELDAPQTLPERIARELQATRDLIELHSATASQPDH